jgi:glycosyltransferase involved in cell wall biosynthesis
MRPKQDLGRHMRRKQVCIVSTVPFVLNWFMAPHIKLLSKDYDVTLVTNGREADLPGLLGKSVSHVPLRIERKISIWNDLIALVKLWNLFRKVHYDSVHSIMPKSGLLSMLAAKMAGVPVRIHTFTGQVWANKHGLKRAILKFTDKVIVMSASLVLADSHSQSDFLVDNNVVKASSIKVFENGSIAGVDTSRFRYDTDVRDKLRKEINIPKNAIVFLFLGRLSKDKGLIDLSMAFEIAVESNKKLHLLVVGNDEDNLESIFSTLSVRFPGRVHRVGYTDYPERYMSASDIFCLPSYREGFGTVLIEAAAVGLPAIASRIYGITDAVLDDVTGILHKPGSKAEIANAMSLLAYDGKKRGSMGQAAKKRVVKDFSVEPIAEAFVGFYRDAFSDAGKSMQMDIKV